MRKFLFLKVALFFAAIQLQAQQPVDPRLKGLDTFALRILKEGDAPGVTIAVVEKNKVVYTRGEKTLMVLIPGQPDYKLKIAKGYSVKFAVNEKGEVTAMRFIQPNGTFKAIRKK